MVCVAGEEYVVKNLTSFERSELLGVIGGYVTSGVMMQLKDLQTAFEKEIKARLHTLAPEEIVFIVRIFS